MTAPETSKSRAPANAVAPMDDPPRNRLFALWFARFSHASTSERSHEALQRILRYLASEGCFERKPRSLRIAIEWLEQQAPEPEGQVFETANAFAEIFELAPLERDLLALHAAWHELPMSALRAEYEDSGPRIGENRRLAHALGVPRAQVDEAMRHDARLQTSGLLMGDDGLDPCGGLNHRLGEHVRRAFRAALADTDALRACLAPVSRPARLAADDFAHLGRDLALVERYLERAARTELRGANVLLHGAPGTGKTELARVLAKTLGFTLYEVASASDEEESISGLTRMTVYRTMQHTLRTADRRLVLFDEIEDVFLAPDFAQEAAARTRAPTAKAFIQQTLETNAVPTIWISNQIAQIDPAVLRRFDYVLELRTPPRSARRRMIARAFDGMRLEQAHLERLAEDDSLTPASIERVSRVAKLLDLSDETELATHVDLIIERGSGRKSARARAGLALEHDATVLNTSVSAEHLERGLRKNARGSLLFHGPPGTGKTQLARHLAERLERPLLVKTAGDLLSCWVGDSEKNIAAMFERARDDGAVLLLDEADSLLRPRGSRDQRWEVSQVNELLARMERFDGVFICTTNMLDGIDPAALRRFGAKVEFRPMSSEARWRLLETCMRGIAPHASIDETLRSRLEAAHALVPGDYAAVIAHAELTDADVTAEWFVDRLIAEGDLKRRERTVGFGAR